MPAEYFEDPVSNDLRKEPVTNPATAPFDVGSGSVRLPPRYQAAGQVGQRQPQDHAAQQANMALVDVSGKAGKVKKVGKSSAKSDEDDDEDGEDVESDEEQQEFGGLPEGSEPQPTLLEMQDEKQRQIEQQQEQAISVAEQAVAAPRVEALVQQQTRAGAGNQEREASAQHREEAQRAAEAMSAADFVAAESDFAGKEPGTPSSPRASASGEQIWSMPPRPGPQPEVASSLPNAPQPVAAIQQASKIDSASRRGTFPHLDILQDDGIPDAGQTGEEGEKVMPPAVHRKFGFRNRNEDDLKAERELRRQQRQIAEEQEAAREALAALKAKVYQAESFSKYRLKKHGGLQTDLRRAQLLADANQYKAHLAKKSREEVEERAGFERALHLSEEALAGEQDARLKAEREQRKDTAKVQKIYEEQVERLKKERREAEDQSFQAALNATQEILRADQDTYNEADQKEVDQKQAIPAENLPKPKKLRIVMRPSNSTETNPVLDSYVQAYPFASLTPGSSSLDVAVANDTTQAEELALASLPPRSGHKDATAHRKSKRSALGMPAQYPAAGLASAALPNSSDFDSSPAEGKFPLDTGPSGAQQTADSQTEMIAQEEMRALEQARSSRAEAADSGSFDKAATEDILSKAVSSSGGVSQQAEAETRAAEEAQVSEEAAIRDREKLLERKADKARQEFERMQQELLKQQKLLEAQERQAQERQARRNVLKRMQSEHLAEHLGPEHGKCTPSCTWQCDNPRCDQVCEPVCQPPKCQTRCSHINTTGCVMECAKPHCAVVCPKNMCASNGCPVCVNTCSKPMCKLQCPHYQPCQNECQHPQCEFKCKAPESCPKPKCKMVCQTMRSCQGYTYQTLPPLQPNESLVQSFAAPSSLKRPVAVQGSFLRTRGPAEARQAPPMIDVPVQSLERSATEESQDLQSGWQPQQRTVSLPAL